MKTPTIEAIDAALEMGDAFPQRKTPLPTQDEFIAYRKTVIFALKLAKVIMGEPSEGMLEAARRNTSGSIFKDMIEAAIKEVQDETR